MKHTISSKGMVWTNVQSPEPRELAELVREIGLEATDAEFVAQDHHRPEITVRRHYILFLIHALVFDRKLRVTNGVPLYLIVKDNEVFSLHYQPIVVLDKIRHNFESSLESQEEYFGEDSLGFALYLMTLLYDSAFQKLERLNKHIDIAEDAVFQGNERKMVEEISILARDVMDFRKIIRPQTRLFASLPKHKMVTPTVAIQWQRAHGQLLKMWEVLESMFESVRELASTNFTLLQHKENELLRLLTMYSIIAIPILVLVEPYFNPGRQDGIQIDDIVFWVVMGLLLITLLVILVRVKRKSLW